MLNSFATLNADIMSCDMFALISSGTSRLMTLCQASDLIRVPDSTKHWFDMGPAPLFTAIRFFTEADGWVGYFTDSDIALQFPRYEPIA
mgnify:CR=1 FL=1